MRLAQQLFHASIWGQHGVSNPNPKKKKNPFRAKLSTILSKADAAASIYIRMKAADHAGCVTCITGGKYLPWTEAHCAHYIERAKKATRWTEENLAAACPGCNVYRKEFHMREYTLYMIDTYGREKIAELKKEASSLLSPSQVRSLAEEALEYYTNAIKEL